MNTDVKIDDPRFLSKERCDALGQRVIGYTRGGGITQVAIVSEWISELRWARNAISAASERQTTELAVSRQIQGLYADAVTNQTDPHSLEGAVKSAETRLGLAAPSADMTVDAAPRFQYPNPTIWSDATSRQPEAARTDVLRTALAHVVEKGMMAAGYLNVTAGAHAHVHSNGVSLYARYTRTQYSVTIRNPTGTGSGWAGASSYEWTRFDPVAITQVALDKCIRSQNPVRVEPGRYTVIMEPQATYDLLQYVVAALDRRYDTENRFSGDTTSPFWDRDYYSKLGQRLFDERITIEHDPNDPELGVLPFSEGFVWYTQLQPHRPVKWVDRGILTAIGDDSREYVKASRVEPNGNPNSGSVRMSGGTTSIEEMIASTKRGVLVTRFSGIQVIHIRSMLLTGYTRDGLWLIEDGKISKAIKNFRFTESPLFVFNNVEQLGVPVHVFNPSVPVIVPPVKARDFSFTSLADAV